MSSARITYSQRSDVTAEAEVSVLANVYRHIIACHARKEAAPESRPEDARKDQDAGTQPHCT
jgi:hypothetical protein